VHIDLHTEDGAPARLDADVAIIGAGAAGLTICRRLLTLGHRVVLLESGGTDFEAATAELNAGTNVGQAYYELDHSRLRFFGGTTAIWGGRCAELDPIDFEERGWVPHSGWPVSYDELRPYYSEAWQSLGLGQRPEHIDIGLPAFRPDELCVRSWQFDERADRFSFALSRDLILHPNCIVVTHATVREIVAEGEGQAVANLDVQGLNGRRIVVRAAST
jgi:choline dehydrogenase-like flavoprotein